MFVVHALILTFLTTPLVLFFYPERVRTHEGESLHRKHGSSPEDGRRPSTSDEDFKTRISVILDKIDQLPAAMMLSQLITSNPSVATFAPFESVDEKADILDSQDGTAQGFSSRPRTPPIHIDALRLVELTTRTSAVLKSQEAESLLHNDPVVSIFRTFGGLNKLEVSASLSVVNYDEYPDAVAKRVKESESQLVVLPWSRGTASVHESGDAQSPTRNPFDGVFHKSNVHIQDQTGSVVYSEFIRGVFLKSPSDVALFVDRGFTGEVDSAEHHLFLPFFGGPDDRLALTFLVQLCHNPLVTATVIRITKTEDLSPRSTIAEAKGAIAENVSIFLSFHQASILTLSILAHDVCSR